ncbi:MULTISPECIES: oligopeptide ABC transporter permease [Brevibacillus]|jgi:ABC-type dipeptide/oligopeptide/nickel transport systems, permease components|uniref:oligopeptide ABC transporter permease n=1 Tax=Brevibacillus TaxID=55080 RepID=UPI00156B2186|nr:MULTISPECIES: oligopeptide ABC transporter permease [Brevibacillus]MED2257418.1 ABC transporter permease [Brevibacillus parabrevis]UED71539.1 ABC transporter permease [Brevibacillus sp. HD3.3A]
MRTLPATGTSPHEITDDLFVHEPFAAEAAMEVAASAADSPWKAALKRLGKNRGVVPAFVLIMVITVLAFVGPLLTPYTYDGQNVAHSNLPPKISGLGWLGFDGLDSNGADLYAKRNITEAHWFGTDEFGRDMWTRVWKGTQISLLIALVAALLDLFIGVLYGGISAYYGGKIDNVMQRIIEVLVGIPNLIVIILFILILEPGITSIILAMTITGWVGMARIVRGQILQLKGQEFVLAARSLGVSNSRIMFKHLIPNALGPIIVTLMFTLPTAIFFEAFLSFIGLGLQAPLASLGVLINDGYKGMRLFPYKLVIPAVMISLIMISFNLLADGLRDALDPKMTK